MCIEFKNSPLVSICCNTYNHENYIRQCLEGFAIQKTTFNFEILVHEDASTDQTANIVKEYEITNTQMLRCVYQTENQFRKQNTLTNVLLPMALGKYIALCEGDDYWTDPYKLQKQVDFLEAHKEYSFCFHNSNVLNENEAPPIRKQQINGIDKDTFFTEDLIRQWFIPTASMVFVKDRLEIPDWFKNVQSGDIALALLLSLKGPAKYLDEVMSVYRLHPNGLSNTHIGYNKFLSMCYLYQSFNIHTNYKFNDKIIQEIKYEFERHALGYENKKLAEAELKNILASTEYLSSKVSFGQALVLLLYKLRLGKIYKIMRRGLKG